MAPCRHTAALTWMYSFSGGSMKYLTGRGDRTAPRDLAFYRQLLDALWDIFGVDRLIYGSNWPVSERFASYATVFGIVQEFFEAKGRRAMERFFAGNAQDAYMVVRR